MIEKDIYYLKEKEINKIIRLLNENKVGVLPTNTILGLVGKNNNLVYEKINNIKNRKKKITILISSEKHFYDLGIDFKKINSKILNLFQTGKLTILINNKSQKKIGIKWININKIKKIILKTGPLLCTSVNKSGDQSALSQKQINNNIKKELDFLIYTKIINKTSSTIYDLEEKKIIRKGEINV